MEHDSRFRIRHVIGPVRPEDWEELAGAMRQALPDAIATLMGRRFTVLFYSTIARQDYSCALAARDEEGRLLGICIGTLDSRRCFRDAFRARPFKLLTAARWWANPWMWWWIFRRVFSRLFARSEGVLRREEDPRAENLLIWVTPYGWVTNATQALRRAMERFYLDRGLQGPYVSRTVANNEKQNRSLQRAGARLVRQVKVGHHVVNVYYIVPGQGTEPVAADQTRP
jgi:hypothetical protein